MILLKKERDDTWVLASLSTSNVILKASCSHGNLQNRSNLRTILVGVKFDTAFFEPPLTDLLAPLEKQNHTQNSDEPFLRHAWYSKVRLLSQARVGRSLGDRLPGDGGGQRGCFRHRESTFGRA